MSPAAEAEIPANTVHSHQHIQCHGAEQQREAAPSEHALIEAIGRGALALSKHEHAKIAPGQERRRDQAAERAAEHDGVVKA